MNPHVCATGDTPRLEYHVEECPPPALRSVPAHYPFLREDFRQIERRISRVSGSRTPSRPLGSTRGKTSWRASSPGAGGPSSPRDGSASSGGAAERRFPDRKSTRLNSRHQLISYAVLC